MTRFQERLKGLRKEKYLTQQQLVDQLGVSVYTVSIWERGESRPEKKTLQKLAEFFGVSPDYLEGTSFAKNVSIECEKSFAETEELRAMFYRISRLSGESRKLLNEAIERFYIADDATDRLLQDGCYDISVFHKGTGDI